jgi:hypothetical protein
MSRRFVEIVASTRAIAAASVVCIVAGAIACGEEPAETVVIEPAAAEAAPVVAPATAEETVVPPPPPRTVGATATGASHGGTVVVAGEHDVEVVPHASGEVYAYVLGDPPVAADTELTVVVPVTGGTRTVVLEWAPGESRWEGRVRRVEIVPGPVDVILVVGGTRWLGHATTIVVLPAIVVVEPSPVVVVTHGKHRKHRKHRGHGHGHGHRHGHGEVIIVH